MRFLQLRMFFTWVIFAIGGSVNNLYADETTIRLNNVNDPKASYVVEMLKLSLQHIDKPYRIELDQVPSTQSRIIAEVTNANLDLFWSSTSLEFEEQFIPVRIPLYKGLIGHRLLIIRQGDQHRFDNVKTLDDLKKFTMGQGTTWADTKIMEANGLTVVKATKYPSLFYMLDGGRFDAFPRGVGEPFGEVESRPELKLTVEKNLMLVYRMPFYIFVRKGRDTLAKDLEGGFNRAIADGSFEKLFLSEPTVQDVIQKANLSHRTIIHLQNPILSKETPVDRAELWVDPKTLGQPQIK